MELENNFKDKKKQLELAIWQKNVKATQECKVQLESFISSNTELSEDYKNQANELIKKADDLTTSLTPTELDLQISNPMKQEEKKLSLRSRARQSHLKFMHQSKSGEATIAKPLLSQMFQAKTEPKTLQKRRSSIHRSLTFIDLPEIHHRHDDEDEVHREELEGHVICMCLSRLHEVLNTPNAKLINKIVNLLSNDKSSTHGKQKLSDEQLVLLRKMFNELDVDGSGAIDKLELKSFLVKLGHKVQDEFVNRLFKEMDINGDGSINFVEFMSKAPSWLLDKNIQTTISMKTIKELLTKELPTSSSSTPKDVEWKYLVHWSSLQGKRNTFEDRVVFFPYLNELLGISGDLINYAAIFDGHNGDMAAEYSSDQLYINILRNGNFVTKNYKQAIYEGFVVTDEQMRAKGDKSGTTATVVLIIGDHLFCANVGDTKGYLYSGGAPIALTKDHVASDEAEKERITKAGGMVVWYSGGWRVNGQMAVSRSIGDSLHQNLLIAEPHIFDKKIEENDEFIILASDGLWDCCTPDKACEFVKDWYDSWKKDNSEKENEESVSSNASAALADWAFKETKANDNATILVMFLKEVGNGERKDKAETLCN